MGHFCLPRQLQGMQASGAAATTKRSQETPGACKVRRSVSAGWISTLRRQQACSQARLCTASAIGRPWRRPPRLTRAETTHPPRHWGVPLAAWIRSYLAASVCARRFAGTAAAPHVPPATMLESQCRFHTHATHTCQRHPHNCATPAAEELLARRNQPSWASTDWACKVRRSVSAGWISTLRRQQVCGRARPCTASAIVRPWRRPQ